MDALNNVRQRQLRDVVTFFMKDMKNDPKPNKSTAGDSGKTKLEDDSKTTTR